MFGSTFIKNYCIIYLIFFIYREVFNFLERLRRKDDVIKEALLEKQKLVADILHVPKEEFETIADLVTEPAYDKEASELVLAAVNQGKLLIRP